MASSEPMLVMPTDRGIYCPSGDFFVDPHRVVEKAIITHAHSDHARRGSGLRLTSEDGLTLVKERIGDRARLEALPYGETRKIGEAWVSLHPSGHMLGAVQVRIETQGRVCVITGDYKRQDDPVCRPFETVPCHELVTECTFGLPIYQWPDPSYITQQILAWWARNRAEGRMSVLLTYAVGKAQRLLGLLPHTPPAPILVHPAIERFVRLYQRQHISFPPCGRPSKTSTPGNLQSALLLTVPQSRGTRWLEKFQPYSLAMASGWMAVQSSRRHSGIDEGFVLSDHVDWNGLVNTVRDTGARRVRATHGDPHAICRFLTEQGLDASPLEEKVSA